MGHKIPLANITGSYRTSPNAVNSHGIAKRLGKILLDLHQFTQMGEPTDWARFSRAISLGNVNKCETF